MNIQYMFDDYLYIDPDYSEEVWVECPGFPDYMISDCGRLWSNKTNKFMHPSPYKNGHLRFGLRKNGMYHFVQLSRLMAEAFIPNPNKYPLVRHLNDIPDDNDLSNLAWGTYSDNVHDSIRNNTMYYFTDNDRALSYEKTRTPINAINVETGDITTFPSQSEAVKTLNVSASSIYRVLTGKWSKVRGYTFEYLNKDVV